MIRQRTLKNLIRATGSGLHIARQIRLTLCPAPQDSGIVFRRVDLEPVVEIPVRLDHVDHIEGCIALVRDGARVAGVEHLLSAFAGLGVDNVCVELDAPEVPVMDGSAGPFVFLVQAAGIAEQAAAKRFIRIRAPVEVRLGRSWARLAPYDGFKASYAVDFEHPGLRSQPQAVSIDFSAASFVKEISRARSFLIAETADEVPGVSLNNTVLVDEDGIRNEGGLRYRDEFVKHKLLDAVGDLYLLGHPLMAAYSAYQAGHALNRRLLDTLQANPGLWETVIFDQDGARGAVQELRRVI